MTKDNRDQKLLNEAHAILRPGNAEFAEAASLDGALDALRGRRRRQRSLRWGLPVAAAAAVLLATVFLTVPSQDRVPEVTEQEAPAQVDSKDAPSATDERIVRTRSHREVVRTTIPGAAREVTIRTADRERSWEPMNDDELLTLFGDQPVGLVAFADGRRQLIFPEDFPSPDPWESE